MRRASSVTVRGDAVSVHDHADAALVTFGIIVVECHDIDSAGVEIPSVAKLEGLGARISPNQQGQGRE